ncbi:LamG-like jellyroll fold domain-containing protein [Streptomyces sp. NPDC013012]|uniref:LamG-like jellyroll fold domain-containing protein n=1 Tax=Streptomyces sp. NPDC013012 TaxID=3364860 RepID=UPI0036BA87BD
MSALAMGMVVPSPAARAAAPTVDLPVLGEADLALKTAKESGQRVEVESKRSERASVFANSDGFTFTLEQHTVPVRVAKPGGGWQVPDPTLEKREDGSIGPKAASAVMSFSGGGNAVPLVEIADRGRSLELDWPGDLPVPEVDGANAVYRDVLPDVDLRLTATVESFQQVLVVKTPAAAANPALKELTFGLKAHALTVREGAAGSLAAVDGSGATVFRAPPARMWDSAGKVDDAPGLAPQLVRQTVVAANGAPSDPADPSEQAPSGTGLQPGQGDNVARMDVDVKASALTVVPDSGMLSSTASEDYPVFIDPTVTWGESERTQLRSDGYESYGWGNGDDNRGQGVGKCGSWNGYYCGPGYVQRLYFEFAPDQLKGKQVLDATFAVTEPWSFQCDPRQVDLVRTNNISSATTWASRPAELDWMVDLWVSAGRGSLCDPDSPDAPIEFNDNPQEPNENLTPTVQAFAAGKFSRLTLEIRAGNETDTSAWKRFRNDAVLRVLYVAKPAPPTNIGIVSGSSRICDTNAADPTVTDNPQPTFTATPQTAPGGESQAKLRTWMRLESKAADGTWSGTGIASPSTSTVPDNWKTTAMWPTKLIEGRLYRYSAATQVFTDANVQASASGYPIWCYFKVDPTAPKAPIVTFGNPYKPCSDPNDCPFYGAPGVPGTVSFKPASGDTIVSYHYRLSNGYWAELSGSSVTATIKPPAAGTYTLFVRAEDPLGRWGTQAAFDFKVAKGADPVGRWQFMETSGAALDDAPDGGMSHATLYGAVTRDNRGRRGVITHDKEGAVLDPQVVDRGLSLGGTTGYASTAGPIVTTSSSYTISAWVRLEDGSGNRTALGQDGMMAGGWYSAFYLGYRSESKKWEMRTSPKDAADGNITSQLVQSKQPATLGVWTHLTAVYDAPATEIRLYVNGELQGTDKVAPSWASTGKFQIGRVWWHGAYYDHWKGSIDEVTVWQNALDGSEILDEARALLPGGFNAAELVADWSASGASGTTVSDTTSGYGKALTLTGSATVAGEDIVFDGVDDAATYKGPLVDDTGSFTVTTQVALDKTTINAKSVGYVGQVLGQRTADGSAWGLWYQAAETKLDLVEITLPDGTKDMVEREVPVGYWHFGRLNADGTFSSVRSEKESELDTPVRLTGVYDAQAATISLRVGTELEAVPKTFTAKIGTGELTIAKGLSAGTWKHFLAARVSDIRVWSGAVHNETQIDALISS